MKKRVALVIAACVAGSASGALASPKPFSVIAVRTSSSVTAKASAFTEQLLTGKTVVGKDSVKCKAASGKTTCTGTFTFKAGGTITIDGALTSSGKTSTFEISGGTGPYSGTAGKLELAGISTTRTKLTFDLS
jgi:hypothetical protein